METGRDEKPVVLGVVSCVEEISPFRRIQRRHVLLYSCFKVTWLFPPKNQTHGKVLLTCIALNMHSQLHFRINRKMVVHTQCKRAHTTYIFTIHNCGAIPLHKKEKYVQNSCMTVTPIRARTHRMGRKEWRGYTIDTFTTRNYRRGYTIDTFTTRKYAVLH